MFKKLLACALIALPLTAFGVVGRTVMVDTNGVQIYPANGFSTIILNGQPLTSWTNCTVTNTLVSSNWTIWVASTNINVGGHDVTNAANMVADSVTIGTVNGTTGTFWAVTVGAQTVTNWATVSDYATPTNWANYPAVTNINANGMTLTNVLTVRGVGNVLQIGD